MASKISCPRRRQVGDARETPMLSVFYINIECTGVMSRVCTMSEPQRRSAGVQIPMPGLAPSPAAFRI